MILNFLLIFISYCIVMLSVIGFGSYFLKIFFIKENNLNYGYQGLFGIFFYAHSLIHNSIILIIGLFLFFNFFF